MPPDTGNMLCFSCLATSFPPSYGILMVCQLLEIMHQAKQFPLPVNFGFAAQGETVQAFVAASAEFAGQSLVPTVLSLEL